MIFKIGQSDESGASSWPSEQILKLCPVARELQSSDHLESVRDSNAVSSGVFSITGMLKLSPVCLFQLTLRADRSHR